MFHPVSRCLPVLPTGWVKPPPRSKANLGTSCCAFITPAASKTQLVNVKRFMCVNLCNLDLAPEVLFPYRALSGRLRMVGNAMDSVLDGVFNSSLNGVDDGVLQLIGVQGHFDGIARDLLDNEIQYLCYRW